MKSVIQWMVVGTALTALAACAQLGTMAPGLTAPGGPGASSGEAAPASGAPASGAPASDPAKPASEPAPSGPTTVSVSIRSACAKTVKVFYGDKPKFGSGTSSTVSSNSVSNKTFKPGDMMWVVDDKDEGLASVKIEDKTKELEIGSDCKSIKAK